MGAPSHNRAHGDHWGVANPLGPIHGRGARRPSGRLPNATLGAPAEQNPRGPLCCLATIRRSSRCQSRSSRIPSDPTVALLVVILSSMRQTPAFGLWHHGQYPFRILSAASRDHLCPAHPTGAPVHPLSLARTTSGHFRPRPLQARSGWYRSPVFHIAVILSIILRATARRALLSLTPFSHNL